MRKIKRAIFLTALAAVNTAAFAPSAHAGYYVSREVRDAEGTLLGYECAWCWFYECNC